MSFAALSWKLKIADQICHLFLETGEGPGLLRLHSTYRHDLKIYSSDEGRVQVSTMSAMVSSVANFQEFWNFFGNVGFLLCGMNGSLFDFLFWMVEWGKKKIV